MVSVSYSLAVGDDYQPDVIAVGSSAPGAGDVEVRVNMANVTTRVQIKMILEAMIRRIDAVGAKDFLVV